MRLYMSSSFANFAQSAAVFAGALALSASVAAQVRTDPSSAEVINEPAGASYFVKKHIGQPKYEELTLQLGFGQGKALYDWISKSWKMTYVRKDVKLTEGAQVRPATQCLVTETTVPALDAARREPGFLTLKFAPETIRTTAAKPQGHRGEGRRRDADRDRRAVRGEDGARSRAPP
jgi:hypothetical protein